MNFTHIILIIIALYFFKNMATSKDPIFVPNQPEVEIVTPHFVYQALNQKNSKIILVNVLSDKMKYKITLNGFNDPRSLSKQDFEDLLKKNNNQIPDGIDKVIIYCASWSCSGAKNYYKNLIKQGVNVEKVVDYIGAIHEWATYADITPSVFTYHSTVTNQVLNTNEVRDIRLYTAHDYFVDNVLADGYLKNLSQKGKEFKSYL
jgi:hypothetical protein